MEKKVAIIKAFGQSNMLQNTAMPLDQEFLVGNLIENEHFTHHSPPASYRRKFWKWIIQNIESNEDEVDERIYSHYLDLLPPAFVFKNSNPLAHAIASTSGYTTYIIEPPSESSHLLRPLQDNQPFRDIDGIFTATLLESRKTVEQGTTGLRTWQPSLMLADWILRNPEEVKGDVLELGCGVGLLGIITASIQKASKRSDTEVRSYSLCMSDVDEIVVTQCRRNLQLPANGLVEAEDRIGWTLIDWRDALPNSENRATLEFKLKELNPSIVLGADLVGSIPPAITSISELNIPQQVYELSIIPALGCILEMLISCLPKPPTIILTITVRRQATIDTFLENLAKHNLRGVVCDMRPFEETVFGDRQYDVDKGVVIQLVRVFKNG